MATSIPEWAERLWPAADEVSNEELECLAEQRGIRRIESIDDVRALAQPGAFESEAEHAEFLADLHASRRADP